MGELLTHNQRILVVHISTLFICSFTKFEVCCYAQTIFMQVLEEYLNIHNDMFQIEGAKTERMIAWVSFSSTAIVEGKRCTSANMLESGFL